MGALILFWCFVFDEARRAPSELLFHDGSIRATVTSCLLLNYIRFVDNLVGDEKGREVKELANIF